MIYLFASLAPLSEEPITQVQQWDHVLFSTLYSLATIGLISYMTYTAGSSLYCNTTFLSIPWIGFDMSVGHYWALGAAVLNHLVSSIMLASFQMPQAHA